MATNGLGVVKRGHECWWCVSLLTKNSQAHVRRDTHYVSNGWTNWELWYGLKLELLGVEVGLCENKVHIGIVHVSVDSHIYDMEILCECKSFTLTCPIFYTYMGIMEIFVKYIYMVLCKCFRMCKCKCTYTFNNYTYLQSILISCGYI
jgi:hypothetical protein